MGEGGAKEGESGTETHFSGFGSSSPRVLSRSEVIAVVEPR